MQVQSLGWEASSGGGHGSQFQVFLPGESHGQRSLVGCGIDALTVDAADY